MTIFECEDTVDGIFTAVYEAWASRLGHANVGLQLRTQDTRTLFFEYRSVVTDEEKAGKVARTIRQRMGDEAYETLYRAALGSDDRKADAIYRVVVLGLSAGGGQGVAGSVLWQIQDPNVCRVFELSREVGREAHRYLGFVRFQELANGVLFSEIEAKSNVLPLIGNHFADRFPKEHFVIYDHGHRTGLVHPAGKEWFILHGSVPGEYARTHLSSGEAEMQRLWRGFCRSISIPERENPKCQQQFWPMKFRKWMTEGSHFW